MSVEPKSGFPLPQCLRDPFHPSSAPPVTVLVHSTSSLSSASQLGLSPLQLGLCPVLVVKHKSDHVLPSGSTLLPLPLLCPGG